MDRAESEKLAKELIARAKRTLEEAEERGVRQPLPGTSKIGAYAHTDAEQHAKMRNKRP